MLSANETVTAVAVCATAIVTVDIKAKSLVPTFAKLTSFDALANRSNEICSDDG